jgi:hypothetical protein
VRLAALAALGLFLLAGCGGGGKTTTKPSAKATFQSHLKRDGQALAYASTAIPPPRNKSMTLWASELRKARRRVHAAVVDLAALRPPANARADTSKITAGFRYVDTLLTRLAPDVARRNRAAFVRDGSMLKSSRASPVFDPFNAAVRDLQRKGYDVGVLGLGSS